VKQFLIYSILLFTLSVPAFADDIFLLTQPLEFSEEPGAPGTQINVLSGATLMKRLSTENGLVKVQVFQENGREVNKIRYLSEKWFNLGTSPSHLSQFHIDPNVLVERLNAGPECEEDTAKACAVLDTENSDVALYTECFEAIQNKISFKSSDSAYTSLSKLYALSESEKRFMAMILTMYGEARGTTPPEEHMAAVMKVITNRTRIAKAEYPDATELDVVLHNSQFSMFNPRDPNWKAALKADAENMKIAIGVFVERNSYKYRTSDPQISADSIFHYMSTALFNSKKKIAWASDTIDVFVNEKLVTSKNAHVFFDDIAWNFTPKNRYKKYAKKKGIIK
jgi:hypothetical protein